MVRSCGLRTFSRSEMAPSVPSRSATRRLERQVHERRRDVRLRSSTAAGYSELRSRPGTARPERHLIREREPMPIIDAQLHDPAPWLDWSASDLDTQHSVLNELTLAYLDALGIKGVVLFTTRDWGAAAARAFPDRLAY